MDKCRKYLILLLIVCMVSLVGCSRTRIVDKLSIIHVFGFDLDDDEKLIGTALYPDYTKSKGSGNIHLLQEDAAAGALLLPRMATHTSTPVELAKVRVLVFGKGYAEAGIGDVIERILVNPQIGTNIQIAVSTHSAKETLNSLKKREDLTLSDQIKQNMIGQLIPDTNLHDFLNHFYGEGMDAYVPMLTIDEDNTIQVDKVGIFQDDKFKLHLNIDETFIFSILEDFRTHATYKIDLDDGNRKEVLLVRGFRSKSKWEWAKDKQQLNLSLDLIWTITHRPQRFDLENPKDLDALKKLIVKNVKEDVEELLDTLKENQVDPIGIGNIVRSQERDWDEASFYEQYPSLPINVEINLEIIHSGLQG